MPPELYLDPTQLDLNQLVADQEAIRAVLPQRYEMEQLTAIVFVDPEQQLIAGYKDVRADEFWVRGHMPGAPLLPGVLLCEAAAQLCSFYISRYATFVVDGFVGFGGLDNVRFRAPVRPGDRLVLIAKASKLRPRQCIFDVQGFVGRTMVFQAQVWGIAMTADRVAARSALA